jgi:hypothetical protein
MQVQRRVKELLGEREAVARSARYVLRAFADWGVISDLERKGEYSPIPALNIADTRMATWLLETAVLSAPESSIDFSGLVSGPSLFPFHLGRVFPEQLMESGRLEVVRHGLESAVVRLRSVNRGSTSVRAERKFS